MLLLVNTTVFIWILWLLQPSVASSGPSYTKKNYVLDNSQLCGKEFSHDIISVNGEGRTYFEVGEIDNITCDASGSPWNFDHQNYPDLFLIYPQPTRTCTSYGIWSGPIPICIRKYDSFQLSKTEVKPSSSAKCPSKQCLIQDQWENIGGLHKDCKSVEKQSNSNENSTTTYDLIFAFNRPYYFSFVLLDSIDIANVQLFARKRDIIKDLSEKSRNFLLSHFDNWQNHSKSPNSNVCPVINTTVYSNVIRVRYTVHRNALREIQPSSKIDRSELGPARIRFFRVLKCIETEDREENWRKCPAHPKILHANIGKTHNNSIEFKCDNGYIMTDPISGSKTDGILRCVEGDWSPYPFPVCKAIGSFRLLVKGGNSNPTEHFNITFAGNSNPTEHFNITFVGAICSMLIFGFVFSVLATIFIFRIRNKKQKFRTEIRSTTEFDRSWVHLLDHHKRDSHQTINQGWLDSNFKFFPQRPNHAYDYPRFLQNNQ